MYERRHTSVPTSLSVILRENIIPTLSSDKVHRLSGTLRILFPFANSCRRLRVQVV
jgi:hypothetical protein